MRPQMFLLHFAGGNCYSFQFLTPRLKSFDVTCFELPGRGRRMEEALLTDFDRAASDLYRQIVRRLSSASFMIYGHSMGAYLGLRVARMLEEAGYPPSCLFVSGNPGPGIREDKLRYLLRRDEFWEELKKLGGLPEEFLDNKELFDLFEPILRADFEIAERNDLKNELPVRCPLYALMGDQEEKVELIENWGRYTNGSFQYRVLEGDHFFIHRHAAVIAGIIEKRYNDLKVYL